MLSECERPQGHLCFRAIVGKPTTLRVEARKRLHCVERALGSCSCLATAVEPYVSCAVRGGASYVGSFGFCSGIAVDIDGGRDHQDALALLALVRVGPPSIRVAQCLYHTS